MSEFSDIDEMDAALIEPSCNKDVSKLNRKFLINNIKIDLFTLFFFKGESV